MITKYIIHGGYTRLENELNYSFFRELTCDIPDGATILMCFFASGDEDECETYDELCGKITKYSSGKNFIFIYGAENTFLSDLIRAAVVYFHGGNTRTLLRVLEKYPDFKTYLTCKTVAGSSAGAYMLAAYGAAHSEDSARVGLGIINKKVVCHYKSMDMPPTTTSLDELTKIAPELETVYLKDCEWKVVYQ